MKIEDYINTTKLLNELLMNDYNRVVDSIIIYISKENLSSYEKEDLIDKLKYKKAYETLFSYYMKEKERSSIIREI